MQIQTLDASTRAEQLVPVLKQDGCAVIRALVPTSLMDTLHGELRPFIDATAVGLDEFSGFKTQRTGALVARSRTYRTLALHPLILETAQQVLGPYCQKFQLHLTQAIKIAPGETPQDLHRDQLIYRPFEFPVGMECEFHTVWALTDFTAENGATRVIPGSHLWNRDRQPREDETVSAEMPKGSVFVFTGSVFHGGCSNRSDAPRIGVQAGYNLGWLRQEENQYLAVPPAVARELPEQLQKLIGYTFGGYALGYFGDVQHPREALQR